MLVSKVENKSDSEMIGVDEHSDVIEEKTLDHENYSNDPEANDFVENFEMYLENDMYIRGQAPVSEGGG